MADKYMNKYRIPSARASWWQYHWAGAYFITICTKNHEHLFGTIKNGIMYLSPLGIIADILWYEIPHHHLGVELGAFVVMPNHIHGILILDPPTGLDDANHAVQTMHASSLAGLPRAFPPVFPSAGLPPAFQPTESSPAFPPVGSPSLSLSLGSDISPSTQKNEFMASISPKSNSVSAVIRSYKSAVTKHANRLGLKNGWQPRFHDHIIRNDAAYQRISDYIEQNPQKWESDKFKDTKDDTN